MLEFGHNSKADLDQPNLEVGPVIKITRDNSI